MPAPDTPIRVMIVDDSVVARRVIDRALSADPRIQVLGTAPDGELGLKQIRRWHPDLVVLDLEMPVLDGAATMTRLRHEEPRLPVLVFSALPRFGSAKVLSVMSQGAVEFVAKPDLSGGLDAAAEAVAHELLPVIFGLTHRIARPDRIIGTPPEPDAVPAPVRRPELVVVAASTGGPMALAEFISSLPQLPVPLLIVQHMPAGFTEVLANRLAEVRGGNVREAIDAERVAAGMIRLAPGGRHLAVEATGSGLHLRVHDGPRVNFCRPSADVLFNSARAAVGGRVLAVVMTGMGHDGMAGAAAIRSAGGTVLAQSPESCVVASMPLAVADVAARSLSPAGLAQEVARSLGAHQ